MAERWITFIDVQRKTFKRFKNIISIMFSEVIIFFSLMIYIGACIFRICKEGDYDDYD